jgi:hypothetical protein
MTTLNRKMSGTAASFCAVTPMASAMSRSTALFFTWTRMPQTHPLRAIKKLADEAPATLLPVFDAMYADGGRPSIPPERLLKSMLRD